MRIELTGKPVDAMPMERRLLPLIFRQRVRILRRDGMVLACRRCGEAVARRRRRVDELGDTRMARGFEHVNGALDVGVHVFGRPLDRGHDVADPGEVQHIIDAAEQALASGSRWRMSTSSNDKSGLAAWCSEIGHAAAAQIVDHADAITAPEQSVDHMAADEAGAAGDDGDRTGAVHFAPSFFMVRTL